MNPKKTDCVNMPAQNMQCYRIYGTPPSIKNQSFSFEVILMDSIGARVTKFFNLTVNPK